jgi:hypothetical protein
MSIIDEGFVAVFNSTTIPAEVVLNGQPIGIIEPLKKEYDYQPFRPKIVDRIPASELFGKALFGTTNTLRVHLGLMQTYEVTIDHRTIPLKDNLQLFIFNRQVILAHNGQVVTNAAVLKE